MVEFPYNSSGQNELFFDGKRMTAARWPNEGEATIDKVLSTGTVMQTWRDDLPEFPEGWVPKEERIISEVEGPKFTMKDPLNEKPWNRWTEAKDPVLYGRLMWEWSDEGIPISIKSDGVITSDFPVAYGVKSLAHFYIWNLLEELDLPGEWYLDRESGELYFYPISDVNGNVLLSLLDKSIINIKNATHISFKNFRLEASKEHGINIVKSSNITVEGLTIKNMTKNGIHTAQLTNCKFLDLEITGCGENGATIDGGNQTTYERANNLISNCHIYSNAKLKETYAPGIRLTGCGNTASHNLIHDMPHAGINFNGSYNIIEYNELYDVVNNSNDMGAIYSFRLRTHVGSVVRNNYIHDLVPLKSALVRNTIQPGVYLDGGRSFVTVEKNIFENIPHAGINTGGRAINIKNNIFINVGYLAMQGSGQWGTPTYQNLSDTGLQAVYDGKLDLSKPPYSEIPNLPNILEDDPLAAKHVVYDNNVLINAKNDVLQYSSTTIQEAGYTANELSLAEWKKRNSFEEPYQVTMKNAGFVNPEKGNYLLREDSSIYEVHPDFEPCDFINVGLYDPWVDYKTKGTISLKIGSPKALNGTHAAYIDEENSAVVPLIMDNTTYVPLRFIAESLGSQVEWDDATSTATVKSRDNVLTVNTQNGAILFNGEPLNGTVRVNNSRSYVPLRVITEAFKKQVSWYEQGLILIGDKEFPISKEDVGQLERLDRRLTVN